MSRGAARGHGIGREAFDLPPETVWLDTAHQGPLPRPALEAAARVLEWKRDPSRLPDREFFLTPERLRSRLASLLACSPEEVVLGDSASHGLHALAQGLDLADGDEVLLVRDDFPATVLPWLPLRARGVVIRFLRRRAGLGPEEVANALGPRTRVVCMTWVDSFSGHVLDIEATGRICRDREVLFILNGTQGVGVRPLPVERLPVDGVTCAGYKWLCGPYGTGFCWISPPVLERLRSGRRYWLASAREGGLDDLARIVNAPGPQGARRHDTFGTADFFNVVPWTAALDYLLEVGIDALAEHNRTLVEAIRHSAEDAGCALAEDLPKGDGAAPFVVFKPPAGQESVGLAARLRDSGIHVSVRGGRIRVSPHVHNDLHDVERFAAALSGRERASGPR